MRVRIPRLHSAQFCLPQTNRRYLATLRYIKVSDKKDDPISQVHPRVSKALKKGAVSPDIRVKPKIENAKCLEEMGEAVGDADEFSEVHEMLHPKYEIGGNVKEQKSALDLVDETGLPFWNSKSLSLKVRSNEFYLMMRMHHFWLRDNCRCSKCVNQDTMQRALDTFSIPKDIKPNKVVTQKDGLEVTWANDGHVSLYPWKFLMKHRPMENNTGRGSRSSLAFYSKMNNLYKYWGSEIGEAPPSVSYNEIMASDKGVAAWTQKIREYGFCYVDDCPVDPAKTEELLERISFIRVTHYGGFYDFTSDLTMKDTAYTSLALPAHTDTTYFTDPAGLQMFHLLSHTDGEGGASLLVDGFNVARKMRKEHPKHYKALRDLRIPFHASGNEGITITPSMNFPVINNGDERYKDGGFSKSGNEESSSLMQIRWNNDDRGVVPVVPNGLWQDANARTSETWYEAARIWNDILKSKEMEYWAQLKPGRPLIFDNWRVLHGRSAFTGKRRICGGYINHDDYISRWRNTNFTREEALAQIL